MKKRLMGVAVAAAGVVGLAIPAAAHEVPEHGHVKLLGVELDENFELTYRRCIDFPSGRGNSWKAHHYGIHTGTAGEALEERAGHWVIPTNEIGSPAPLPSNCTAVDEWWPEFVEWFLSQPPSEE
jgi:hypothetical protein